MFWNKAPLHDGAVIVREGRIVGAGCMLPLSGNVNLSRDLGMRHRAGIGMSEHSDAVVVIVSEETRLHLRGRGRHAQAASGTGDLRAAAAERAVEREQGGGEEQPVPSVEPALWRKQERG